jgi:quaternary ammonium compound-resistance protein SugE
MDWISLFLAGVFEVVWSFFMKQSNGFTRLFPSAMTVLAMLVSFGLLAYSMRTLPLGTAYTIWTGIGAVGAFVLGIALLGEQISAMRLAAGAFILIGIVLMKLATPT